MTNKLVVVGFLVAMMVLLLAIIAFLLFSGIAGGVILVSKAVYRYREMKSGFTDFFITQDKDGLTQFTRFISDLLEAGAVRVGQNVQNGIKGSIGGTMKGVAAEIEEAAAGADPAYAIMAGLPKSVKKNSYLMAGIQYFLNQKMGGGRPGTGGNNGGRQAGFDI